MATVRINIANKLYKVEIASSDEAREQGLQNRKELPADEGMLFVYEDDEERSF
jgi:uncharacterized membrane protein (UPF0127 family)